MITRRTPSTRAAGIVAILAIAGAACGPEPEQRAPPAVGQARARGGLPIDRIGWLHLACLAIDNKTLAAASPLTVVMLDDRPSIVEGTIVRPTDSANGCPALNEDRRAENSGPERAFYEVAVPQGVELGLAIGVLGKVPRVGSGLDVDGDGRAEQFTQCTTSEGVSFAVWNGAPYQGTPLWSGYYYLGYDTDSTCPS